MLGRWALLQEGYDLEMTGLSVLLGKKSFIWPSHIEKHENIRASGQGPVCVEEWRALDYPFPSEKEAQGILLLD